MRSFRSFHRVRQPASGFIVVIGAAACGSLFSGAAIAGSPSIPVPQARMGAPIHGLTPAQLQAFLQGRVDYNRVLSESEGLGPCFNKPNCGNCHNNPVGGPGSQTVTRFGLADKSGFDPLAELGGSLLQSSAIAPGCQEIVPPEANITAQRVTNGAQGYGLIEAIPDAALLANRDAQPTNPNVRGVAHMVEAFEDPPLAPLHVGRFGWKAQVATILTFSADAALNEMGLTNRFISEENAPNGDLALLAQYDLVSDPEDGPDSANLHFIDRVTNFQRYLTHPPQTPRSGMSGEAIFNEVGCAVCHTPSFTTNNSPSLESALRNKTIRPYSDFLLHDMGLNADFIVQGQGTEQLLKTPPLWGMRKRDPMWHDGRVAAGTFASRVTHAIALHDDGFNASQGRFAAATFAALPQSDKDKVIAFLDSLGRIEFDADGDDDVQIDDFVAFADCFGGGPYNADAPCAIHDIDQDTNVDMDDFNALVVVYQGIRRDCNGNGILDFTDILNGAPDANNNGLLDSCEPTCDQDVNGSGGVDVDDLLAVITGWGTCAAVPAPCRADLNGSGSVDVDDLLAVIVTWGPCQ